MSSILILRKVSEKLRMNTEPESDERLRPGQLRDAIPVRRADAWNQDSLDSRLSGSFDDGVPIRGEFGNVEVAMRINNSCGLLQTKTIRRPTPTSSEETSFAAALAFRPVASNAAAIRSPRVV